MVNSGFLELLALWDAYFLCVNLFDIMLYKITDINPIEIAVVSGSQQYMEHILLSLSTWPTIFVGGWMVAHQSPLFAKP
jgi:hypothetical protein